MLNATISAETWISVIGAVFTAAASGATIVAVLYARRTVDEARAARAEGHAAHEAELAAIEHSRSAAAAHAGWLLGEMQRSAEAAAERHRVDVEDHQRIALTELRDRQLEQLERISALILRTVDVARTEHRSPPEPLAPGHTGSGLPAMLLHLENLVASFAGRDLPNPKATINLAARGRQAGTQPLAIVGMGVDALYEIQDLTLDVVNGKVEPPPRPIALSPKPTQA